MFVREGKVARETRTASPRIRVWTTSRFQKNETVSCHNERIRRLAAEFCFVVSLASLRCD